MSSLESILVVAAALAGITGTWSPCGFSMIETIGPVGHTSGRATTICACVTFTLGALAGGTLTFGSLALAGSLAHGADHKTAYGVAAAVAIVAALAELRGTTIAPQVRRQLPEHWRRLMPMPVAAGLYGVLLGLGFTTFVLTFGVFALAGIAFAVGEPALGVLLGLAFGVGRALPVAVIAPIADREIGIRVTELMAGRPSILRGFRLGDGVALAAAAAALLLGVPANASRVESRPAADPAVDGQQLALQRPDRSGFLQRGDRTVELPGADPAVGDGMAAVRRGDEIVILDAGDLEELGRVAAPGVDAIAISSRWLAWRARVDGRDYIRARKIDDPQAPGPQKSVERSSRSSQLGRPSLDANRVVYARAGQTENSIVKRLLGSERKTTLIRSRVDGLSNPTIRSGDLLYVRHTAHGDVLKLASLKGGGKGRTLLSKRTDTLWSTALSAERAYVTEIRGTTPRQRILSVGR